MVSLFDVAARNPFSKPTSTSVAASAGEVEFGSTEYYLKCCLGGSISCGLTHTMIVPLDLVKCRMQVDAAKYPSLGKGFKVTEATVIVFGFLYICLGDHSRSRYSGIGPRLGTDLFWLLNARCL